MTATLSREGTYHLDLGTDNFTRMDNVLDKMENLVTERVGRLNEHKKQLKEVTDQIGKGFPKEEEFQAKTARLAVLNAELDTDGKKNEQGGITQDDTHRLYRVMVLNDNINRTSGTSSPTCRL